LDTALPTLFPFLILVVLYIAMGCPDIAFILCVSLVAEIFFGDPGQQLQAEEPGVGDGFTESGRVHQLRVLSWFSTYMGTCVLVCM
jgi:hypothetical protein